MDVDYDYLGTTGATLLGLSFAAIVFAYNAYYAPWMPDLLKARVHSLVAVLFVSAFAFGALFFLCSIVIAAVDFNNSDVLQGEKKFALKWTSLVCQCLQFMGIMSFLFALVVLLGVQVFIVPFPS